MKERVVNVKQGPFRRRKPHSSWGREPRGKRGRGWGARLAGYGGARVRGDKAVEGLLEF